MDRITLETLILVGTDNDTFVASIDDLVRNFQSALTAVVPMAEKAKMIWADVMNQHYKWEELQQCLFDVFVAQPIRVDRNRTDHQLPLPSYDIDLDDYSLKSWITCQPEPGIDLTLVRLVSKAEPFDTVQAVELNPLTYQKVSSFEILFSDLKFYYMRRAPDVRAVRLTAIEAVE